MDGNSAFDGAESKARWQTLLLLEDGDTAMLVLERTVYLLWGGREWVRKIENMNTVLFCVYM